MAKLKQTVQVPTNVEVKLKSISEAQYFDFLSELRELDGVVYAVATDAGLNKPEEVKE